MTANFKQRLAVPDKIILYKIYYREKGYKTRSVYTINKHITVYMYTYIRYAKHFNNALGYKRILHPSRTHTPA